MVLLKDFLSHHLWNHWSLLAVLLYWGLEARGWAMVVPIAGLGSVLIGLAVWRQGQNAGTMPDDWTPRQDTRGAEEGKDPPWN